MNKHKHEEQDKRMGRNAMIAFIIVVAAMLIITGAYLLATRL